MFLYYKVALTAQKKLKREDHDYFLLLELLELIPFFYLRLFKLGFFVSDFFLDSVGRCRTTVESSFAFDNKCQTFRRNNKKDCVITRIGNFEGKKFLPFFEVLSLGLRR